MDGPNNGIVLYHYTFSPFARRVTWYLALRGIDYAQCLQPPIMPRPDLEKIGINHRRIPIMAVGRDVYCDSRLILRKLEQFFPVGALGATQPDEKALERLLEQWTVGAGVFSRASQLIPTSMPLLNDPKFTKDREDFSGRSWDKTQVEAMRPESIAHLQNAFSLLEKTMLADGRRWILKTPEPSLADIEAIWVFDWLNGLKDALPKDTISGKQYPKVFGWIQRFDEAIKAAKSAMPKPTTLKGGEAAQRILAAKHAESDSVAVNRHAVNLEKGEVVEVWPIDTGVHHRDRGRLLGIDEDEIVLELFQASPGEPAARLHFPRTNFRVSAVGGGDSKL